MGTAQVRILMGEDEASVAELMRLALRRQGWQVDAIGDGLQAAAPAQAEEYDLALTDHQIPSCSGPEGVWRILATRPEQRIAMVTGTATDDEFRQLMEKDGC